MMKFNSQICTTREQSERLLALGLKPETADMYYSYDIICAKPYYKVVQFMNGCVPEDILPAWSMQRLIETTSDFCDVDGEEGVWCCESRAILGYRSVMTDEWLIMWNKPSLYDNLIDCIEWLIKEGNFPKEYLV